MGNKISGNPNFELVAQLEALLFVAPGLVSPLQLANTLDLPVKQIEESLKQLELFYNSTEQPRGIRLQRHHGRVQLITAPSTGEIIEKFLGLDTATRLSRAALETLAVIAYKEPITRPQIDAIRGVNSDGVLKNLLNKGLIQEVGRAEAPGRPILYSVTSTFLQHFGLNSLEELPPLENNDDSMTIAVEEKHNLDDLD